MSRLVSSLALVAILSGAPLARAGSCLDRLDPLGITPQTSAATLRCGTRVEWIPDPAAARAVAARTGKLLFVMHISGEFHDPGLT